MASTWPGTEQVQLRPAAVGGEVFTLWASLEKQEVRFRLDVEGWVECGRRWLLPERAERTCRRSRAGAGRVGDCAGEPGRKAGEPGRRAWPFFSDP